MTDISVDDGRVRLAPLRQPAAPLRQQIIVALRKAIEIGDLKPGMRLIERDLCEQLGVSRSSLREALSELQADGILEYVNSRRLVVSAISREDAENVYRIRSVIEALVVEQFIEKASDGDLAALLEDGETLKDAYRSGDLERMLVARRAFHDRICSGAANPTAFGILMRLVLRTSALRARSLRRKQRPKDSIRDIDSLLQAIQRRDAAAASRIAALNVMNAARSALGATEEPDA